MLLERGITLPLALMPTNTPADVGNYFVEMSLLSPVVRPVWRIGLSFRTPNVVAPISCSSPFCPLRGLL